MFCLHANETLIRLEQTPKLVIAALNGHCVGGGMEIAMAADIRIARKDAGKIGLPEVALGVLPGTGGTQRLARLVGKSRAIELMVTGKTFSYEQALDWGVVSDIYEGSPKSFASSDHLCAAILHAEQSADGGGTHQACVQTGAELPLQDALALERELQSLLFKSEDAKEGIASYNEKRVARFENR